MTRFPAASARGRSDSRRDGLSTAGTALLTILGGRARRWHRFVRGGAAGRPALLPPLSFAAWRLAGHGRPRPRGLRRFLGRVHTTWRPDLLPAPASWLVNVVAQGRRSSWAVGLLIETPGGLDARARAAARSADSLLNGRAFYADAPASWRSTAGRSARRPWPASPDHFKKVNDTSGHHEGDRVLRAVAATILRCTRATDLAARMGGDEFVLLCRDGPPGGPRRSNGSRRSGGDPGPDSGPSDGQRGGVSSSRCRTTSRRWRRRRTGSCTPRGRRQRGGGFRSRSWAATVVVAETWRRLMKTAYAFCSFSAAS